MARADRGWKHRALNNWQLLAVIAVTMSLAIIAQLMTQDLASAEGVSAMIAYSVRWAVPWLFIAFAASSIQRLFPRPASGWLLRNRKIFGLAFAVGMAWQASFILWLLLKHQQYYVQEVYVLRDAIEGAMGYLLLTVMIVTSFRRGRKRLSGRQWKLLHTAGIYWLWAYAFSVYWHELYYYSGPQSIDYAYYYAGLLAWTFRLAAWTKQRLQRREQAITYSVALGDVAVTGGMLLLLLSLLGALSGTLWIAPAYSGLYGFALTEPLELYLPYWPFIPFLPLFAEIAGGALLSRRAIEETTL